MVSPRSSLLAAVVFVVATVSAAYPSNQCNVSGICDPNFLQQLSASGFSFQNTKCSQSAGGKGSCIEGILKVTASANNSNIVLPAPANNSAATEMFIELFQRGSTLGATASAGSKIVSGTFGIYSKLCIPADTNLANKVQTVQFLTHGGTLDRTYWDFSAGNSYVDVATAAGYATFAYDRLGSGLSDHPDPAQYVQLNLQVQIAHNIVQMFRKTSICGRKVKNIVGVGHSEGSGVAQSQITVFPKDFDAAILTGTSAFFDFAPIGVASTDMIIANTDPSGRFKNLTNGYFTPAGIPQALQFAFYRYPNYDQKVFDQNLQTRQTNALGEMLTLGLAYTVANGFTGPLDVVNGENDLFYCGGNCKFPSDQAAAVKPAFFPNASANGSQSYLVPGAGHNVALAKNAGLGYAQMVEFLKTNAIV